MRVLVTGHQGYLGTVMVPILQDCGARRNRFGLRLFRRLRARAGPDGSAGHAGGPAGCDARAIGGFRGGHPPRRVVQRPARCVGAADHLRHQPPRLGPAGPTGERGRCAEVPLRLHLLGVRGGWRGSGHRECSVATADPVRGEQGPGGGRRRRDRGRLVLAGVPAQRHGVRFLAAAARRHRAEQSGRSCGPHRRRSRSVGRHTVASAGARAGHRDCFPRSRWKRRSARCIALPTTSEPNRTI